MKAHNTQILKLDGSLAEADSFDQPVEDMTDALPLIYQAGYLTIKDFKELTQTYTLGIPNNEVRTGLMKNILPMMSGTVASDNTSYSINVVNCLSEDKYDEAMEYLCAFLTSIPYLQQGETQLKDLEKQEALYQNYLYVFFSGMGYISRPEPTKQYKSPLQKVAF